MKFLHVSLATVAAVVISAQCWAAPLSLEDCLQQARNKNPSLKSAAWDKQIAEENGRLATVAKYPRVDAHSGYTLQAEPQAVKMRGEAAETQEQNYAFAGIGATYTIYDFGRRDARVQQSNSYTEAAAQSFMFTRADITLQVIETYFRILEAEKMLQAANDEVIQLTEHRRIAQVLLEEGSVTRNDLLQAEVRLAAAVQKRLAITNKRENGWLLLNFLTGNASDFRGELIEIALPESDRTAEAGPGKRYDIKAQQKLVEAREFEVSENKENYFPEIYTRLGMDYVQNDKVREQIIYSATVGIRVNIFDGFAAHAAREKAVRQRSKELDKLRLTEQRAQLEIATSRNDVNIARERIAVAAAAIKQSEESLRISRERYQERVGIASEVLDAQSLVTQAKTDYYRADYDYQTAIARLQNALGEL